MKYLDFYAKLFNRYKIIVYGFIATIIMLEHRLIAYTFYALSAYEFSILCIDFYKESRKLKYDNRDNDIMILKLKLEEKKEESKKHKETFFKRKGK